MKDARFVRPEKGTNNREVFLTTVAPCVEHRSLEQRSRDVREDKTRIRFARSEPSTHKGESGSFWNSGEPGAWRNLPTDWPRGRDVLNVQRTRLIQHLSWGKIKRIKEGELQFNRSTANRKVVGDGGLRDRCKEFISRSGDKLRFPLPIAEGQASGGQVSKWHQN